SVTEHFVRPANRARDRFRVWIHDNLVGIETVAGRGIVRSMYSIAVELVWPRVWQEAVPHHVGVFRERDARTLSSRIRGIEQAQFHSCCMGGEQREVHAHTGPGSPKRIWIARPDSHTGRGSRSDPQSTCSLQRATCDERYTAPHADHPFVSAWRRPV